LGQELVERREQGETGLVIKRGRIVGASTLKKPEVIDITQHNQNQSTSDTVDSA